MFRNNETEYSKVIYLYHNKIGFRVTFSFQKYFSLNVFLMFKTIAISANTFEYD